MNVVYLIGCYFCAKIQSEQRPRMATLKLHGLRNSARRMVAEKFFCRAALEHFVEGILLSVFKGTTAQTTGYVIDKHVLFNKFLRNNICQLYCQSKVFMAISSLRLWRCELATIFWLISLCFAHCLAFVSCAATDRKFCVKGCGFRLIMFSNRF